MNTVLVPDIGASGRWRRLRAGAHQLTTGRRAKLHPLARPFAGEPRRLPGDAPPIATQRTVATHDAVAGDEHRDPVAGAGPRYSASRGGATELFGHCLVAARRT